MFLQRHHNPAKDKGFTLIEILIVIALIAILATIGISTYTQYRSKAYRTDLEQSARQAYAAAHRIFVSDPSNVVTTEAQLTNSGFRLSNDVIFVAANMSINAGSITLMSTVANVNEDQAVVDFNGSLVID